MTQRLLRPFTIVFLWILFLMPSVLSAQQSWITSISENTSYRPAADEVVLRASDVSLGSFAFEENVTLDLFDGLSVTAERWFIDEHTEGSRVWVGRIANQTNGYVLISLKEDAFWCKVELDDGAVYTMNRPSPSANYLLKQIAVDHYFEDGCANMVPAPEASEDNNDKELENEVTNICEESSSCASDVIKYLVVYNSTALSDLGGSHEQAIAAIAAAISEMNLICANSNVAHRFTLVHTQLVTYTESGSSSTDLGRLRKPDDDYVDTVHFLRDKYYADLVSMVLGSGSCGIANVSTNATQFSASQAFSCCSDACMTGNKSLAHEAGHNLALRHDRYAYGTPLPNIACDFGWGYVNQEAFGGRISQRWRTVMAYNSQCSDAGFSCTRITQWSNPDVNYRGDPTGIPIGDLDEAHSQFVLDRSMCWVAEFRTEPDCSDCTIYLGCKNYDPNTNQGVSTFIDVYESVPFANPFAGDIQVCVVTFGDNNGNSEDFDVKDENGDILGQTALSVECKSAGRVCFEISPGVFNEWLADGNLYFELDPTTNAINPNLCSANRACVEILLPNAPDCLSTGTYGTPGQLQMLPSGIYEFSGDITLTNFYLEPNASVILRTSGQVNLAESFALALTSQCTVEDGNDCED